MTQPTYEMLTAVRRKLAADTVPGTIAPSYVWVPWAGEQIIARGRGIYFIGIAPDKEESGDELSFDEALRGTETFCRNPTRGYTRFWQFVNRLTQEILGARYDQAQDRWGWSNLLKVAGSKGGPSEWPPALAVGQRLACRAALQEELARLRESLIVVTSEKDYGILYEATAEQNRWDRSARESQAYFLNDPATGNVFVHCYHPNAMRRPSFFEAAVTDVVRLAREMPSFR